MKQSIDIIESCFRPVIFSPIMCVIVVLFFGQIGAPELPRKPRTGLDGRPFGMIKFRPMRNVLDRNGCLWLYSARPNRFRWFLRISGLESLLGLWNVLREDMNFVGPQPSLMEILPRDLAELACRHLVRPRVSSWTQVNGRDWLRTGKKLALEVWYVENHSFWGHK